MNANLQAASTVGQIGGSTLGSGAIDEPLMTSVLYVARQWRVVGGGLLLGLVFGAMLAVVAKARYSSSASFFTINRSSMSTNLSSLAGSIGLGAPQQDPEGPQFFADLVRTNELIAPVVREPVPNGAPGVRGKTLMDLYANPRDPEALREDDAIRTVIRDLANASVNTKTGVIKIVVTTRWPEVSQWLAARLLDRLNAFNLGRRRFAAGEERRFAEGLLKARDDSLRDAEERLEAFVQSNRDYRNSPSLTLQAERLQREVGYQLSLRNTIASMYQESRVREVRDTPVIVVVEPPRVPVQRDPRGLGKHALLGAVLGGLLAIGLLVFLRAAQIQRLRGDSEATAFLGWIEKQARHFRHRKDAA